jgi:D-inositol-3-phosphate glycosyltransferase
MVMERKVLDRRIRLLWVGDSPAVSTGFGRVAQGVLEGLYQTGKYEISVLGINHPIGDPHRYEGMFRIYPAKVRGNVYGLDRIEEVINKEKPDVIIINNDLWIVSEYIKVIPAGQRIITYSPVDALPVDKEWLEPLINCGCHISTYTEFAKKGITDAVGIMDIPIIGHGVDTDEFYPIDDARSFLSGIPKEAFVVQNINRNQPRKRIDLFLKSMQYWINSKSKSDRDNIFFYYHGTLHDVGWNLVNLAKRWGIDDKMLITDQTGMSPANGVSLNSLCRIYNVANVHVLTSMGEGFGLSPFESAACGITQVVPDHSACKELWQGVAPLINIKEWQVLTGGINTEGGIIDVEHLASILDVLYNNRDKCKVIGKNCYDYVHQEKFSWSYVSNQFDKMIIKSLDDKLSIKWEKPKTTTENVDNDN